MILHPRHRLDIGLSELAFAARACVLGARESLEWDGALICQSVRSAFDLFLTARALPRGSEVLVTALTIPDMVRVLEDHGLVAVPVDLDPRTLAPKPESISAAITPRTRAVLVAHLLGGRLDLPPIAAAARGLVVIEDAAQGFAGPRWQGHPEADVTLFSFGSIKTATALGGALAFVRDPAVRRAMAAQQERWPVQPVAQYARKIARTIALHAARDGRGYGVLARGCELTGRQLEDVLHQVTRGFPDAATMLTGIRRQPCGPLVALLRRRLERFDGLRLRRRAEAGEALAAAISDRVEVVGAAQPRRTHWLFAITVEDPDALIARLYARGFDATRGATSLTAVAAPPGRTPPRQVQALLRQIVFLPAWPEVPAGERARLAEEVNAAPSWSRSPARRGG